MSPHEIQILLFLMLEPGATVTELSERLVFDRRTVGPALHALGDAGLVVRVEGEDAREYRHDLTRAGRRSVAKFLSS